MKLTLALLLALSAQAAGWNTVKAVARSHWTRLVLVEVAMGLDAGSTARCINAGTCYEANRWGNQMNAVKMAGIAGVHMATIRTGARGRKVVGAAEWVLAGFEFGVAGHNYSLGGGVSLK